MPTRWSLRSAYSFTVIPHLMWDRIEVIRYMPEPMKQQMAYSIWPMANGKDLVYKIFT